MKSLNKLLSVLLVAMMVAIMFAGCKSGETSVDSPDPGTPAVTVGTTPAQPSGTDATAKPEEQKYGGWIVFTQAQPTHLFAPKWTNFIQKFVFYPCIESLFRFNEKGEIVAWLGESITVDPDTLVITIKLKDQDIYFHDGSLLTADVVKWNLEMALESGQASKYSNPQKIEVIDPKTLEITLGKWDSSCLTVYGELYIFSKEAYEKNGEDWCMSSMVGTGPFIQDEYVIDSHLTMVRNDNYWQEGLPYLDGVKVVFTRDTATIEAGFKTGEFDQMQVQQGAAKVQEFLNNPDFKLATDVENTFPGVIGMNVWYLSCYDENDPLYDVRVRKAIAYAYDNENIAKMLTEGLGKSTDQYVPPGAYAWADDLVGYEYNIEKAKALLAEAGYPNGFTTETNVTSANERYAVALQSALAEIGITLNINLVETSVTTQMTTGEGRWHGFIFTTAATTLLDSTTNMINIFTSEGSRFHSMGRYEDLDAAIFGARAAKSVDEKIPYLQEANKLIIDKYCICIPISYTPPYVFVRSWVHDWDLFKVAAYQSNYESVWTENKEDRS